MEKAKGAPKKGTAAQWKQWLDGAQRRGELKQAERDWLGVDNWLEQQNGPVPRADLTAFVRANQVQVQDVVLGEGNQPLSNEEQAEYARLRGIEPLSRSRPDQRRMEELERKQKGPVSAIPKFATHQLPGGENYRELLLTLPPQRLIVKKTPTGRFGVYQSDDLIATMPTEREAQAFVDNPPRSAFTGAFRTSHFDEPNILAHVRFNERTDADGNKVLFIEEIQSDWHQKGRAGGYNRKVTADEVARELYGQSYAKLDKITQSAVDAEVDGRNEGTGGAAPTTSGVVPDAPFKNTDQWAMLAFKRMARYAAENGFDSIAWTTGEQQAERYKLSKTIEISRGVFVNIESDRPMLFGVDNDGVIDNVSGAAFSQSKGKRLYEVFGKDLAERIMQVDGKATFSGAGLDIGGEGMRGFYDKILPSAVNKWAKKLSGKVGETTIKTKGYDLGDEQTVHNLELTPAMTAAALGGQPLFRMGDGAPTTASGAAHLRRVHAIIQPVLARWGKDQPRVRVRRQR
ncbi:MAG: hypothetical protein L0H83_16315, partial [Salinisphaera sp.]|nr:hypothetical protein [Salinisphaera sp.]